MDPYFCLQKPKKSKLIFAVAREIAPYTIKGFQSSKQPEPRMCEDSEYRKSSLEPLKLT